MIEVDVVIARCWILRALVLNENRSRGDFDEARTIVEEDLRTSRRVYGPSHQDTIKLEIMHQNYLSIERAYQNGAFEDFETFAESFLDSTTGAESTAARQIRDILGGPPGPENAGAHELREMLGSTPEQWQA